MRCDDVQSLLLDDAFPAAPDRRRTAIEHLAECASCRDAQYAAGLLRAERGRAVPPPRPAAFERTIAAASRAAPGSMPPTVTKPGRSAFAAGIAVGAGSAVTAAAIAWAAFVILQVEPLAPAVSTTPEVTLALHQPREVSISVDAPSSLRDAEIRVVLTGPISLAGFAEQRELRWRTDLDMGTNQLTLPIVATEAGGGQLLVEVQHGQRRKTFVVDVRGTEA